MKIFGIDIKLFYNNPTNVLITIVVLFMIWHLYRNHYEGFSDGKTSVVLFYLPGCVHCKDMMPEWDKFQKKFGKDGSVKKIDCSKNPNVAKDHKVKGFPTVIKVKNGEKEVFKGERTAEALEGFFHGHSKQ